MESPSEKRVTGRNVGFLDTAFGHRRPQGSMYWNAVFRRLLHVPVLSGPGLMADGYARLEPSCRKYRGRVLETSLLALSILPVNSRDDVAASDFTLFGRGQLFTEELNQYILKVYGRRDAMTGPRDQCPSKVF